jgi:hypothetical protein
MVDVLRKSFFFFFKKRIFKITNFHLLIQVILKTQNFFTYVAFAALFDHPLTSNFKGLVGTS